MSEKGMRDIVLMKLMGHADFRTTEKYYIFVSDERKKKEYEQAWGLTPTTNEENIDCSNIQNNNDNNIDMNMMAKEFEQLQKIWMQTLAIFVMAQKNNTI